MIRIFLVEDNAADILLVQEALAEHRIEHKLHVVRDGAEALDFISRIGTAEGTPCPDVMLLDLNLPKITGPQVLVELRKRAGCSQLPVIVITSSDARRDRERAAELGAARYFRKPSNFDGFMELGAVIRDVAAEHSGSRGPSSELS